MKHLLFCVSALLVVTACNGESDLFDAAPACASDGVTKTVDSPAGGQDECGGPGPFAGADALPEGSDIKRVSATQDGDSLTVEVEYAAESPSTPAIVVIGTDGTIMDVLQNESGWKVVDGAAKVTGEWVNDTTHRWILTEMAAPAQTVNAATFGKDRDLDAWYCDRASLEMC